MIGVTITQSFDLDNDLKAFESGFEDELDDLGDQIDRRFLRPLLSELTIEPGKPQYPIAWTSDKQRKFVMAKLRRENNLPYRRTGNLALSWEGEVTQSDGEIAFLVTNPTPSAVYVYGSLNQRSLNEARVPQQVYHRNTGWELAAATIQPYADAAVEYAERQVERYEPFVKTSTRRRSRR